MIKDFFKLSNQRRCKMKNSPVRQQPSPLRSNFFQRSGFPRVFDMMNEMDQLFNQWSPVEAGDDYFAPAIDVSETEKEYLFSIDAPGVKEKDINISLTGHQLTIAGERRRESEDKSEKTYRSERFFGRFERSFTLPEEVNTDQIEASFRDGVLEVHVPKVEAAQPKTIAIKSGSNPKTIAASANQTPNQSEKKPDRSNH
jgi:HSP20 family protein